MLGANGSCLLLLKSNESLTYLKHYRLDQEVFETDIMSNDWRLLQWWSHMSRHRLSLDVSLVISCSCEWAFRVLTTTDTSSESVQVALEKKKHSGLRKKLWHYRRLVLPKVSIFNWWQRYNSTNVAELGSIQI